MFLQFEYMAVLIVMNFEKTFNHDYPEGPNQDSPFSLLQMN
jgi:hypothetical protein